MSGERLQASGGGQVHEGVYDGDGIAGWHPVCGSAQARRWFRTDLAATCPACLNRPTPWTVAQVLAAVDDIADHLEREQDEEDLFDRVERAVARLRALRGDSTGQTEPVARMWEAARLYGAVNTDQCDGCGLPESNCACG